MLNPQVFAQGLLELLVKGAAVGQYPVLPYLLKIGNEFGQGREVGLGHIDRLILRWRAGNGWLHGKRLLA